MSGTAPYRSRLPGYGLEFEVATVIGEHFDVTDTDNEVQIFHDYEFHAAAAAVLQRLRELGALTERGM